MSSVERRAAAKLEQPAAWALPSGAVQPQQAVEVPCITILLCTYNGAAFLAAQLASIEQQTHRNWRLIVSDDGSTDDTLAILHHFAQRVSQPVAIRQGPQRGASANFLSLAIDPSIKGDYFAFCDQDDVWHRGKLERALQWASRQPRHLPTVYGARTHVICAAGKPMGLSRRFHRPPSFGNALVQSIAGANTMLFNRATKQLFEEAAVDRVTAHDWWAYQLVTGSGGIVGYDPVPQLDYRQHSNNSVGSNRGLRAQLKRFGQGLKGRFGDWNEVNIAALRSARHLLTEDARALVEDFELVRRGAFFKRVQTFIKSSMRRQTYLDDFALMLAVMLKKI